MNLLHAVKVMCEVLMITTGKETAVNKTLSELLIISSPLKQNSKNQIYPKGQNLKLLSKGSKLLVFLSV